MVRDLKSQKADRADIDLAVANLLLFKAEYLTLANKPWVPGPTQNQSPASARPVQAKGRENDIVELNKKIAAQSDVVRPASARPVRAKGRENDIIELNKKIAAQSDVVRDLKLTNSSQAKNEAELNSLLALKAEYTNLTGREWAASDVSAIEQLHSNGSAASELNVKIADQGNLIRDLKTKKAEKRIIDNSVKTLQALKAEFKQLTGKEWFAGVVFEDVARDPDQDEVC